MTPERYRDMLSAIGSLYIISRTGEMALITKRALNAMVLQCVFNLNMLYRGTNPEEDRPYAK